MTAVLVQLERQDGYPGSGRGASYVGPGPGATGRVRATRSRLRHRIGEMVAQQAVEDEGAIQAPRGEGLYHRYNAILKRRTGNKPRAQLSLAELEATVSWLERNRLSDHAEVVESDPRYGWTVRQRREWVPPVGRVGDRHRARPEPMFRPEVEKAGETPKTDLSR